MRATTHVNPIQSGVNKKMSESIKNNKCFSEEKSIFKFMFLGFSIDKLFIDEKIFLQ